MFWACFCRWEREWSIDAALSDQPPLTEPVRISPPPRCWCKITSSTLHRALPPHHLPMVDRPLGRPLLPARHDPTPLGRMIGRFPVVTALATRVHAGAGAGRAVVSALMSARTPRWRHA